MTQTTEIEQSWEDRAISAEAALEIALKERARLWEELHELRANKRSVDAVLRDKEKLERSVSWRITLPIRLLKIYYYKFKQLLEYRY